MRFKVLIFLSFFFASKAFAGPVDAYLTAADRALDKGDAVLAVDLLEHALVAAPAMSEIYVKLGESYLQLDRIEQAEKYFRIAVEIEPGSAAAIAGLGTVALGRSDYADAEARLRRLSRVCGEECLEYKALSAALSQSREAAPVTP
ncbi:MAG: tetratricopeptide repeat protein [Pseudomonadota bacterium]